MNTYYLTEMRNSLDPKVSLIQFFQLNYIGPSIFLPVFLHLSKGLSERTRVCVCVCVWCFWFVKSISQASHHLFSSDLF